MAFFLNLYNAMVIHAVIRIGRPGGVIDRRAFYTDFQYIVGGYHYSLSTIKNGILRLNRRQPYSLVKPFSATDKRLEVLLCFQLCIIPVSSNKWIMKQYEANICPVKNVFSWLLKS